MVHGIVKKYGGAIYALSELQIGTTFNVYIPTIKIQAAAIAKVTPELPGGNEHILLVDDETLILDVERMLLEDLGYKISTASGSKSALKQFRLTPHVFDLVLTDMTMPKMTGEKLAVELLKIRPDLPIILCTGYSSQISKEAALRMGIRAFVSKPIVRDELATIVR